MDEQNFSFPHWGTGEASDIVLQVTSELRRNLSSYAFPDALDEEERKTVTDAILAAAVDLPPFEGVDGMPPLRRKMFRDAGLLSDPQAGDRRFFCMDAGQWRWCLLLDRDHIAVSGRCPGMELKQSYVLASEWEEILEKKLDFAFALDMGYLLSDISASGNALFHSAWLFLPALGWNGNREAIFRSLMEEGYWIRGNANGENEEEEELFEIGTEYSFGMSEDESINKFAHMLELLVHYEKKTRRMIDQERLSLVKDRVFRAYGIAASAERIDSAEGHRLVLSLLLGVSFGLVKLPPERLVELLWLAGDATVRFRNNGNPGVERIDYIRSRLGIDRLIGGFDV
ncbi:ATP--guanido phosphotransferase [Sediminispirochaeta smaragdinae]|uniref:ATP:guanido phosphotransferase n=1 Tax=Sediminispirochaeta smaragdinae (strain DSM 11293 / JCM 15392 / SEBR 4228) TaxID=573413 RepID=E1R1B2_SEDSS|nr:ATP--guanido phosphotransferase [Sediminispirochaeta smaragdinae]ADK81053.1 ATP:guanido phosphotransferase [Sediminispirochaeta smaragdinae DSM 11293]